jgi:hypothetical protein
MPASIHVFRQKILHESIYLPCLLHLPFISSSLISSLEYVVNSRSKNYEAHHYAVFFSLSSFVVIWIQVFSSVPCCETLRFSFNERHDVSQSYKTIKPTLNLFIYIDIISIKLSIQLNKFSTFMMISNRQCHFPATVRKYSFSKRSVMWKTISLLCV